MKVKRKKLLILILILFFIVLLYIQNNSIHVTNINIFSEKLPHVFNGIKIVHISDMHNTMFPENQDSLISKIKNAQPDIIVITGDLIDSKKYNEIPAFLFIDKVSSIAPVYYVNGNHEYTSGMFSIIEKRLKSNGIHVLRNESTAIYKNGSSIMISGIDNPSFSNQSHNLDSNTITKRNIETALKSIGGGSYRILLAHHPEMIDIYANYNYDLIFAGHAHGGQFRLPFIGGIYAPNQGFFPKYTSGRYDYNNSVMVVSRGLGNSELPIRIFNSPEIIVATLYTK